MHRLPWTVAAGCLLTACFSEAKVDDTEASTSGSGPGTDTGIDSSGAVSLTSADGPTSPDTTVGPGPDGTDTAPPTSTDDGSETAAEACMETAECDRGLFCIDGSCLPCSDAPDGDALCASEDPSLPYCDPDSMQCAACTPATCSGQTPVCDAAVGCAACTEHSECPDSACHLMGPDQGACFDVADVVEISDVLELQDAITQMGSGDQRVFRLSAETFTFSGGLGLNGEVALLGQPGTVLTGGATNMLGLSSDAYLYVAGLDISDGPFRALNGNLGAGLWIDDTRISGFPLAVNGTCETHVRRSHISGPTADSVGIAASAPLFVENTAIGPNPGIGLELGDVEVDLRYLTIAGNGTSLSCSANTSGIVRNSIIVGASAVSIDYGCYMTFVDNAVDTNGFGAQVGALDGAWFEGVNDYHLTPTGQDEIGAIADWDDGDPLTDIDGDPRPMDASGYPGIDEP